MSFASRIFGQKYVSAPYQTGKRVLISQQQQLCNVVLLLSSQNKTAALYIVNRMRSLAASKTQNITIV